MPLTREQLALLPPPRGWVWHTRPSLRTRGYIMLDDAQGISRSSSAQRIDLLREWGEANDLGIKPVPLTEARNLLHRSGYVMILTDYYEVPFPRLFKVVANKPEYSASTFGEYTCACGSVVLSPAHPSCGNCGTHKCNKCGVGFVKLFKIAVDDGDYMYCGTCTRRCDSCTDGRTIGTAPCRVCDPRKTCAICYERRSQNDVAEVPAAQLGRFATRIVPGEPGYVCKRCGQYYYCSKCEQYDFTAKKSPGRQCASCDAKELDKKRIPLETLPEDWVPAGGNLLIPSTEFRPFRTISIEMELDGDGPLAARTLYACGLVPIPTVATYNQHPDTQLEYPCFLKHDGSVTAGELIAYLLNLDEKAHADVLLDVCKKVHSLVQMKKLSHGPTAGGHIHADAHNYSFGDVWRLLTVFNYVEDPFYRIAGAGSEYGHRMLLPDGSRMRAGGYAASPVKGPFGTKGELGNSIQSQGRHHGLNFTPYLGASQVCKCGSMMYDDAKNCKCNLGKATIEWRVFNSTHNPRILHAWIALVQAMMAWATGDGDPTQAWEANYPPLPWSNQPWKQLSTDYKTLAAERIEWMFRNLPLTDNERDSLVYTIEQTDMEFEPGFSDHLRAIRPLTDFEVKKAARNPARRQRAIRVGVPTPGDPPGRVREGYTVDERMIREQLRRTEQRRPRVRLNSVFTDEAATIPSPPPQPSASGLNNFVTYNASAQPAPPTWAEDEEA